MNISPSRFSNDIPQWMGEAYGRPSAQDAMQWLLATVCQQLRADACLVLRLSAAGTHGSVAWTHGAAMQTLSHDQFPLAGSEMERTMLSAAPLAAELALIAHDPWLANLGIRGGAMVALQQGPVRFGSLGVYFTQEEVDAADALALLTELSLMMWPLLCWEMMGTTVLLDAANAQKAASLAAVHHANNILSNIVLLTDLALTLPCGQQDPQMKQILQRVASESVRCAEVLREFGLA